MKGIAFDDKTLNIDWRLIADELIISKKDTNHPPFTDSELF